MADGFQPPFNPTEQAITRRAFSVAELDAMFEAQILSRDEKIELIDGEIIEVNAQMMPHALLKSRLARKLLQILPDRLDVVVEPSTILGDQTLVDPDVIVTERLPFERRYVQANEVLLAIEVADTSLAYDLGTKAGLYAKAGIPELWVVDINGAQTWVHREPGGGTYEAIESISFTVALTPVFHQSAVVIVAELLS